MAAPEAAKPLADAQAVKLFEKLGSENGVDPKVTAWLTAPDGFNAKSLDDLLYACNEDGIENLIVAADPDNHLLATSRLRQAWRTLKRARRGGDGHACRPRLHGYGRPAGGLSP
jgi:hypothetical protein